MSGLGRLLPPRFVWPPPLPADRDDRHLTEWACSCPASPGTMNTRAAPCVPWPHGAQTWSCAVRPRGLSTLGRASNLGPHRGRYLSVMSNHGYLLNSRFLLADTYATDPDRGSIRIRRRSTCCVGIRRSPSTLPYDILTANALGGRPPPPLQPARRAASDGHRRAGLRRTEPVRHATGSPSAPRGAAPRRPSATGTPSPSAAYHRLSPMRGAGPGCVTRPASRTAPWDRGAVHRRLPPTGAAGTGRSADARRDAGRPRSRCGHS